MPIDRKTMTENNIKRTEQSSFYVSEPKYSFKEVVLSEDVEKKLGRLISLYKNKKLIFEKWGLESVIKFHNLSVNFYGESGTGKTMTAHALASALNKRIIVVNYAEIESKYVGETSKNLVHLFTFAEKNNYIILFDEADALLSRRVTAMYSATDVSVNQTRNTLLKILDEYKGIVIFTTNFIQNFDPAFMRRIFEHIKFDYPDEAMRRKLWNHYLVTGMPINNRDNLINELCKINNLSGSDIVNVVLKVALDLADNSKKEVKIEQVKEVISEIKKAKDAINGGYEITSRRISEEYVHNHFAKGESINGFTK